MRGEKCQIISDCTFDPLAFHVEVFVSGFLFRLNGACAARVALNHDIVAEDGVPVRAEFDQRPHAAMRRRISCSYKAAPWLSTALPVSHRDGCDATEPCRAFVHFHLPARAVADTVAWSSSG
jgi:hypothetical protein